jgi:hypothetical protein
MLDLISRGGSEISNSILSGGIRDDEAGATDFGGHQWQLHMGLSMLLYLRILTVS